MTKELRITARVKQVQKSYILHTEAQPVTSRAFRSLFLIGKEGASTVQIGQCDKVLRPDYLGREFSYIL